MTVAKKKKRKKKKKNNRNTCDISLRVLGVMTGTSCDGLDASCIEIKTQQQRKKFSWKVVWQKSLPYPTKLRERVLHIQKPHCKQELKSVLELDRDLGEWYGHSLSKLIKSRPIAERPELIANHGQTIGHFPLPGQKGVTFQIGDPTRIARETGITVVAGFRKGDMAAGGQGAPLVPLFHGILAKRLRDNPGDGLSIHNIGGISNLTYVSPTSKVLAFDTGPGNIWIDAAMELITKGKSRFDRGGAIARESSPDLLALEKLKKHPYLNLSPPKSTGRDEFPFELLLQATRARDERLVATATAFTISSITSAYKRWILNKSYPLHAVYLCGGGALNMTLVEGIKQGLPKIAIMSMEDRGLNSKFVEADAFAFFGFLALLGHPVGGIWTGAREFGPPGHIVPGSNWRDVVTCLT